MNKLGLNQEKVNDLITDLNSLLANYQLLYSNVRGFHWNIKGNNFFELHLKFEEIYNDLQVKIDEVAERILTLGGVPENTFTMYLKSASIKEISKETNGAKGLENIIEGISIIIKLERSLLEKSAEINDEGTNSLVSGYITEHEKSLWMFNAYLSN